MMRGIVILIIALCSSFHFSVGLTCPEILSRESWGAKASRGRILLKRPVENVVIHHSVDPKECVTAESCTKAVSSFQIFHQETKKWRDIAYNFLIGGDGRAYTGTGWVNEGTHTRSYNKKSIGICFIGDYRNISVSPQQVNLLNEIIECGVKGGHIRTDYKLYGHGQLNPTLCPGTNLYQVVKKHPHYRVQT